MTLWNDVKIRFKYLIQFRNRVKELEKQLAECQNKRDIFLAKLLEIMREDEKEGNEYEAIHC